MTAIRAWDGLFPCRVASELLFLTIRGKPPKIPRSTRKNPAQRSAQASGRGMGTVLSCIPGRLETTEGTAPSSSDRHQRAKPTRVRDESRGTRLLVKGVGEERWQAVQGS